MFDDDKAYALRDITPVAPIHVLIIPKKAIAGIRFAGDGDSELLGHLVTVARKVATAEGLDEGGYRLVINQGPHGGQEVNYLHVHLIGGRDLKWNM